MAERLVISGLSSLSREAFGNLTRLQSIAFVLLLMFTATTPLPWGAVTPAGVLKVTVTAFVLTALTFGGDRGGRSLGAANAAVILLLAVAALGALQLVALPPAWIEAISPAAASIHEDANAVLREAGAAAITPRLSIAPHETVRAALLVTAYALLFVCATKLTPRRTQRRAVVTALVAGAVAQIVVAAVTDPGSAAGQPGAAPSRLHGAFVNPNHLAGYLEISICIVFAMIWTRAVRFRTSAEPVEKTVLAFGARGLLFLVIAAGLLLTQSRAGIAAAAVTLTLLTLLSFVHQSVRARRKAALVAITITLALALTLAVTAVTDAAFVRFLASDPRDPASDTRFRVWEISVGAWRLSPHAGTGLGTYRDAFRRVQPRDLDALVDHAHNDALQMLVTGGWAGLTLTAASLALMLVLLLKGWLRNPRREEAALTLASAGALTSLLLHGLAEFNFSVPAIPATLAVILGTGWSASRSIDP